jgi:polar amino acid transport system substrate-binding protein
MRSQIRAALAIALLIVAVACAAQGSAAPGSGDPTALPFDSAPSASPAQASSPQASSPQAPPVAAVPTGELLFADRLLICSDLPYPPQEFFDEQGEAIGSDIEIGREIAHRLGLEADIVNSFFDTIIEAVNGGKCDIVISAQNITDDREEQVIMIPYFRAGQTFVVEKGNPAGIHTQLDLCGKRIGAQRGTVQVEFINGTGDYLENGLSQTCQGIGKQPIDLRQFLKDEALKALLGGTVDAYFVDSPAAGYHVVQQPQLLELSGLTLEVADQGISVPHNKRRLAEAVRTALQTMIGDGTYVEILASYGVQDGALPGISP